MKIDFLFPHVQPLSQQTNTNWIFIILAVILMVLLAWWVIHSANQTEPEAGKPPQADAPALPAAEAVEVHAYPPTISPTAGTRSIELAPEPAPDDLTIIEGIGPKINSILKAAGVVTFKQLAAMEHSKIKEIITRGGIRLADTSTWPEQARIASTGDMAGLKTYQGRLIAGRLE